MGQNCQGAQNKLNFSHDNYLFSPNIQVKTHCNVIIS